MNRSIATIATLAIAAAAGTATAAMSLDSARATTPAAATSSTVKAVAKPTAKRLPATPVTRADLPAASQIYFDSHTFKTTETFTGEGQETISKCQSTFWGKLGANATFSRAYWAGEAGESSPRANVTIASFSSHAKAVEAAKKMTAGLAGCDKVLLSDGARYARTTTRTVTLPTGQVATLFATNVQDPTGAASVEEVAVVATGTHTELMVISAPTQAPYDDQDVLRSIKQAIKTLA